MLGVKRRPLRTAVLISGGGSTLQALLEMRHQFEITMVISNRETALGVLKARRFGIATHVMEKPFDFDKLHEILIAHQIDRIVLAGFMKILPEKFVTHWRGRLLNIHPSLLPEHPGLEAAFKNFQEQTAMGATIHHVILEMDQGPKFLQQASLEQTENFKFSEAEIFLRRTEQHLLRELTLRWFA